MKKIIFLAGLAVAGLTATAQTVRIDTNGNFTDAPTFKKTGKTYTDSKGTIYPVFITNKGRLFVEKISKKTGKTVKSYLKIEGTEPGKMESKGNAPAFKRSPIRKYS